MVNFVKKVQKKAGGDLLAGESILDARVVQPAGSAFRNAISAGVAAHTGALIDQRIDRWRRGAEAAARGDIEATGGVAVDFPTVKSFFTLTNQRVLVHSFAAMSGAPKDLLAVYPLSDFAGMEAAAGKLVGKLHLYFLDGSAVSLDVMKGGGNPQALVDAFNNALTAWD
ncbi:MAG: hypothetical protein ACK5O2_09300 [Microthrixaceae bacterium]